MGTIILIRHADAGSRGQTDQPDHHRPLSDRGRRESEALADALEGDGIERLLAGPAQRCRQTLEPLGERLGLEVEEEPAITEGSPGDDALTTLIAMTAMTPSIAACSHGDVIPRMVDEAMRRGATGTQHSHLAKAGRFVLTTDGEDVTSVEYLPPPS